LRPTTRTDQSESVGASSEDELAKRLVAFERWSGIFEAADVVSTAIVLGLETYPGVRKAAESLVRAPLSVTRELADRILSGTSGMASLLDLEPESRLELDFAQSRTDDQLRVAELRNIVRRQPRNALRWTDLALAHTVLGNIDAAAKAMRTAISLGNGNRFILRAAARFYVHRNDLEAAHNVLIADEDRLLSDPWLLAAEIAIADLAELPQRYVNRGRLSLDRDFAPRHISELASALSTVEMNAGRMRRARQLLRAALVDPTENSLAQAEWSAERGLDLVSPTQLRLPLSFEAQARHLSRVGEFGNAVTQARLWQVDQPFALDPALYTSYLASTLIENYEAAIWACETGLRTNPGDLVLLNNLAFSQASLGQVDKAAETMAKLPLTVADVRKLATWTATRGLIAFRRGDAVLGRRLYQESIASWQRQGGRKEAAKAATYWAREELLAGTDHIGEALAAVRELGKNVTSDPETDILRERLRRLAISMVHGAE
jgi:tetratricopeptide (TPR) repeat protein